METRIRYDQKVPGVLTSRRHFTVTSGIQVTVELDLNIKKYKILDAVSGQELTSGGNTKNNTVLKLQAKKALIQLGAEFAEESREYGTEDGLNKEARRVYESENRGE